MAITKSVSFEHAARYEVDLSDRQRDVLRLIAAGATNGEIAEKLGLTLAGAKWNVSEILTKLGLDSREQAAEYYRWRSRSSRFLRAIAGALTWKLVAGGAAAAVVAGAAFAAWALLNATQVDAGPAVPGLPFYLEATVTREDDQHTARQLARLWYDDERHGRLETGPMEVVNARPGVDIRYGGDSALTVRDGEDQWLPAGPQYLREDLDEPPFRPWLTEQYVGPIAFASVDDFVADLQSRQDGWAEVTGKGRVLGRTVVIMESGTLVPNGTGQTRITSRRLWVDPARMFLMRSESVGSPVHMRGEVTLLRYGEDQPDPLFVYTPEPGAVEIICRSAMPLFMTGAAPAGFISLPAAAIPSGFAVNGGGTAAKDGTCGSVKLSLTPLPLNAADTRYIEVNESLENPTSLFLSPNPDHVMADGTPAYSGIDDKGLLALSWMEGPLGMQVASNYLTIDELLAFSNAIVAEHDAFPAAGPAASPSPAP
jgi:DNA-binding CsgD family transcriptional regulator